MSEMVERVKASRLPYSIIGRTSSDKRTTEWFIDDSENLPAGVFVSGPFNSQEEAEIALETIHARNAIAAMQKPTKAMIKASLGLTPIAAEISWRAMMREALK